MTIGERIRDKRIELGLSQEELALKCGYKSRSSINKLELSREIPLSKVKLVANALEVNPAWLIGFEDKDVTFDFSYLSEDELIMIENVLKDKDRFKRLLSIASKLTKADEKTQKAIDLLLENK